ncbi:MAG: Uup, transporter ATPase, ATP-binding cassette, subfamily er 3 [Candidatus Saccharibacteria bacterium]|nr:Uup, transporter ATPase, ATP-binding cassette, subfamily er 3 [Candidatus Saccharibacteria bacterium]
MLLAIDITEKSFGDKQLYDNLSFSIEPGEKIGLIGRNGTGKSTLFNMITGDDTDFQGEIKLKRGTTIIASRQEHHGHESKTVLEYVQGDLPEFAELQKIITTYPEHMASNERKLQRYSDALDRFSQLGYFQIEDELEQALQDYQLDPSKLQAKLEDLSGGQKRMVELIKVQRARGNLALIDEPTNHMDYVAKQAFIRWLEAAQEAVLVITHDRDVLQTVDKIVEIRDGRAFTFKGNYKQYLSINKNQITSQVNEYDLTQRRIDNLKNDVIRFRKMKERSHDPGTIKRFKSSENKAAAELERLQQTEKPSFWIDQESAQDLGTKMTTAYQKYKAQNIKVDTASNVEGADRLLVQVDKLSLGYDKPLFEDVSFSLREGERVRLHGRNGAGKTTLVDAIVANMKNVPAAAERYSGRIMVERELNYGLYQQEIADRYLDFTLHDALEQVLSENNLPVNDQKIKQLLSDYLFNPQTDGAVMISRLSGGQKARFQLIRMLINDPKLLILDEPTNHLDLPSIEELENALIDFTGAVIYISHDSYFADKLGGQTVAIGQQYANK